MSVETEDGINMCPRCGSLLCYDPDSKGCSDNCILRLQRDLAFSEECRRTLQAEVMRLAALPAEQVPTDDYSKMSHDQLVGRTLICVGELAKRAGTNSSRTKGG